MAGSDIEEILRQMMVLSQSRGKESSGVALLKDQTLKVLKRPLKITKLIEHRECQEILDRIKFRRCGDAMVVFGHARMVTNGSSFNHDDNQPVIRHQYVCVHNGIFVNDGEIWKKHPGFERRFCVDTEALIALVKDKVDQGRAFVDAVQSSMQELKGGNSIVMVDGQSGQIALCSSNGSLYFAISNSGAELFFCSENYIIQRALNHPSIAGKCGPVRQVNHGDIFTFSPFAQTLEEHGISSVSSLPSAISNEIVDLLPVDDELALYRDPLASVAAKNHTINASVLKIDFNAISQLRRCSKCVLPETFPFITFDESGVCNYCHSSAVNSALGRSALDQYLAPMRRSDGRPDCLVPISGGRDSCYGIHYIKNELKMNPVAYTYDWGMVTDLARRNISRMCGSLGIEHILISADIRRKRENVRRNVMAWLRKPALGTIPLFMAGDKQFFYFANLLKKQLQLNTVLFSMNPLERTDFKVGFCGINENYKKEHHYNLSILNKFRIAQYYGKEFLLNPSYINRSIFDSIFAFFSYYMIPRDYISIFDYIQWDESVVESTLIDNYEWELSPDTKSTWRIGDGTASFYNYIYCRVAGFSENDTLRSNQIRLGQISRSDAINKIYQDNQPRFESIRWYCDTIGLDMEDTIKVINAIPTLY